MSENDKPHQVVPYGQQGVQRTSQPSGPLTRHRRATIYFKAMRMANKFLHEVGFHTVADCGHAGFSIELGYFMLEMMVKEPPMMAHVTSYPGYTYDPNKVTAKVTINRITDTNDYVIQAIATINWNTINPIYIVVPQDAPDVLKAAFMSILLTARDLLRKDPATLAKIQEAMTRRDVERDYDRLLADEAKSQAGASSSRVEGAPVEHNPRLTDGRGDDDTIPV